jgi:hypothetical protein
MTGARQNCSGVIELRGRGETGRFLTQNVFLNRGEHGTIPTRIANIHRKTMTDFLAEQKTTILENAGKLQKVASALQEAHRTLMEIPSKGMATKSIDGKLAAIAYIGDAVSRLEKTGDRKEALGQLKRLDKALDGIVGAYVFGDADSYAAGNVKEEVVEIVEQLRLRQKKIEAIANNILPKQLGTLHDYSLGDDPSLLANRMRDSTAFSKMDIETVEFASRAVFNLRELADYFNLK